MTRVMQLIRVERDRVAARSATTNRKSPTGRAA
jgi:hypothetical protein